MPVAMAGITNSNWITHDRRQFDSYNNQYYYDPYQYVAIPI